MATLDTLKLALRESAVRESKVSLSDSQYSDGFDIVLQGHGSLAYQDFIIPQLTEILSPPCTTRAHISVLEIGPGPKSVLGYLPGHLTRKIRRYAAFEPNSLFAARLEEWLLSIPGSESPLPCLETPPDIRRRPFGADAENGSGTHNDDEFDVILFCHSIYGMKPKNKFIQRALEMLTRQPEGAMVVVFDRDGTSQFDGLICHRTAHYPRGVVTVPEDDKTLDEFAFFVAGFTAQEPIRLGWRKVCRSLARREQTDGSYLVFSAPEVMVAFTSHAIALPELTAQVPVVKEERRVKNHEARRHRPAAIVRPTEVQHVQQCVRWAAKHGAGLTVIGGSHSGHCLWPNIVAVDMGDFDQIRILPTGDGRNYEPLVVVGAGCKTGDVIRKALDARLTVPLGSRPSVGAGLWLQGGIGHLGRLHGLACDAIVGAVMIGARSGEAIYVGRVPVQDRPAGAVQPANETDILWALRGAGTNFGIVVSVTFRAYLAPTYTVRNWILPASSSSKAQGFLKDFDFVARELPRDHSADAYLYWGAGKLHVGVTVFESSTTNSAFKSPTTPTSAGAVLGPEESIKTVDSAGLFESDMYMSSMHGGHGGGKTCSFKRCLFFKNIGAASLTQKFVSAFEARPSGYCYLHLLHGGGAIRDTLPSATAFGCRDWDFACVITGVWPREMDGTDVAQATTQWVYNVALDLLPWSTGAYGADLGPDPRDAALAAKAFGPNRARLARLKRSLDPSNVFAYGCPLMGAPVKCKLILLLTGQNGAGKDYTGNALVSVFARKQLTARAVSISDAAKREYAAATGADPDRLLCDRAYKEEHRSALSSFFEHQVQEWPELPEEHFSNVVHDAGDVDVLIITGMRDEAPVANLSHLVPGSRLLEVRVTANEETRLVRRGCKRGDADGGLDPTVLDYCPSLVFDNDGTGSGAAERFAERHLLPFFDEHLQRLADMVPSIPGFPRAGVEFRHVLNIAEQPGGLALCTSLLQTHFAGDWEDARAVVSCEAGGFVYGPALTMRVDVPNLFVRKAGKLPPPTVSVAGASSHISSLLPGHSKESGLEMGRDGVPDTGLVVVVDDVLATGTTLCAVLRLLAEGGVDVERIKVMVVAEFPVHRGRQLLRQCGFGRVSVQSLLVFDGA
ncbi:hypothetical protein F4802DRAFT_418960 [Xylaria palmicola]|nr:hypothetical protein F4802DRAFT_418960 [Xylaria palmicola]